MNAVEIPDVKEITGAIDYRPFISIIMPFEPKMSLKTELGHSLKLAAGKVERELKAQYPAEICMLMTNKLGQLLKNLNYNTHKKSIAIYFSPIFEKVLYLDMAVEENVTVGQSFEIRSLVYSKKQQHEYLVLLLSGKESRMFIGNSSSFVRIVSNTSESVYSCMNDVPELVANFSDQQERKEVILDKFLHHTDNALDMILNAYRLPLFVLGTERISGHFKKLTRHAASVVAYIRGNFDDAPPEEIKAVMEPHIADWNRVKQKDLLNQLEQAADKKRLATGMRNVWREAVNRKGRLLVVEKGYCYTALKGSSDEVIYKAIEPFSRFSYIKDAVDDAIEKVLENGGDVEFVENGLLEKYRHIALIQYY
jgi:hypothetical protein